MQNKDVMVERRLAPIEESLQELCQLAINNYKSSMQLYGELNLDAAVQIIETEVEIIRLRDEINEAAVVYMVKNAPVAKDLRRILSIIKITADLERISEYSISFSKFLIKNGLNEGARNILDKFINLGDLTINFIENTADLYDCDDKNKIIGVSQQDELIDERYSDLTKEVLREIKLTDDNNLVSYYAQLLMIVKYHERAGDHCKNICQTLLFLVRGKFYNI